MSPKCNNHQVYFPYKYLVIFLTGDEGYGIYVLKILYLIIL